MNTELGTDVTVAVCIQYNKNDTITDWKTNRWKFVMKWAACRGIQSRLAKFAQSALSDYVLCHERAKQHKSRILPNSALMEIATRCLMSICRYN